MVAEGQATEPDYFTALNKRFRNQHGFSITTKYNAKGLHPLEVAAAAIAASERDREDHGPIQEVWALFDRDEHTDVREAFALIRRHNAAASVNGDKQVRVAFSHPSFDLWLLLHFQRLTIPLDGSSDLVHEKLREYPAFERFATNRSGSKAIDQARAAQLMPRTQTAVHNARALVRECPGNGCSLADGHAPSCDPLRRDPSTDVWLLIQSLGIADYLRYRISL